MSALLQQLRSEILAADDLGNIVNPEIARAYKVEKARVAKEEFLANAPAAPERSALSSGIDIVQGQLGSALEGIGSLTGINWLEETGADIALQNEYDVQRQEGNRTRLADVEKSLDEVDDIGSALNFAGTGIDFAVDALLESLPSSVAGLGAAALAPAGAPALAAGIAASVPQFYGAGRERQKDEIEQGNLTEVSESAAALAAIPSAALNFISDKILFGRIVAPEVLQSGRLFSRIGKGAAVGAASEVPTEIGQAILERAQAKMSLIDQSAIDEYIEVGITAGLVGGQIKGATTALAGQYKPPTDADDTPATPIAPTTVEPKKDGDTLDIKPDAKILKEDITEVTGPEISEEQAAEDAILAENAAANAEQQEKDAELEKFIADMGDVVPERRFDDDAEDANDIAIDKRLAKEERFSKGALDLDVPTKRETPRPIFDNAEEQKGRSASEPTEDLIVIQESDLAEMGIAKTGKAGKALRKNLGFTGDTDFAPVSASILTRELTEYTKSLTDTGNQRPQLVRAKITEFLGRQEVDETQLGLGLPPVVNAKEKARIEKNRTDSRKTLSSIATQDADLDTTSFSNSPVSISTDPVPEYTTVGGVSTGNVVQTSEPPTSLEGKLSFYEKLQTGREEALSSLQKLEEYKQATLLPSEEVSSLDFRRVVSNNLELTRPYLQSLKTYLDSDEAKARKAKEETPATAPAPEPVVEAPVTAPATAPTATRPAPTVKRADDFASRNGTEGSGNYDITFDGGATYKFFRDPEGNTWYVDPNFEDALNLKSNDASSILGIGNTRVEAVQWITDRHYGLEKAPGKEPSDDKSSTPTRKGIKGTLTLGKKRTPKKGKAVETPVETPVDDTASETSVETPVETPVDDTASRQTEGEEIQGKELDLVLRGFIKDELDGGKLAVLSMAEYISTEIKDPAYRQIASSVAARIKSMADLPKNFKIATIMKDGLQYTDGSRPYGTTKTIIKQEDGFTIIVLSLNGEAGNQRLHSKPIELKTTLHELIHVATDSGLLLAKKYPEFVGKEYAQLAADLDKVYAVVQDKFKRLRTSGGDLTPDEKALLNTNMDEAPAELLTYGLTDKRAQELLESIPYDKEISVFSKFVSLIREYLNLPARANTVLSEVITLADALLNINPSFEARISQQIAEINKSNPVMRQSIVGDPVAPLSQGQIANLKKGNLKGALTRLGANASNRRIASISRMFSNSVGTTKVELVVGLEDKRGVSARGLFDPQTNTIKLDVGTGLNEHTLLHEMTHALVSATIAKKGAGVTAKLNTLYNEAKPYLSKDEGSNNLDEFVSEYMSNEAFVQELATIYSKESNTSIGKRFVNIVSNFIRGKLGADSTPIDKPNPDMAQKKLSDLDSEIKNLLAPAPESRNAGELLMASKEGTIGTLADKLGKAMYDGGRERSKQPAVVAADSVANFITSTIPIGAKTVGLKFLNSSGLAEVLKRNFNIGDGEVIDKLLSASVAAQTEVTKRLSATRDSINKWLKANPDLNEDFSELVIESTRDPELSADPTKPRKVYSDYYLTNTRTGNRLGFATEAERDQVAARLNAANKKTAIKEKFSQARLDNYDNLQPLYKKIQAAGGKNTYVQLRDTYKELFTDLEAATGALIDGLESADGTPVAASIRKGLRDQIYGKIFANTNIEPYFPLTREGEYWLRYDVTVGDSTEHVVEAFKNAPARNRARLAVSKAPEVVAGSIDTYDGRKDLFKGYNDNPPPIQFIGSTLSLLNKAKVSQPVQQQFLQLFIDTLPESSTIKALKNRVGYRGSERDVMVSFDQKAFSMGRQIAALRSSRNLYKAFDVAKENLANLDEKSRLLRNALFAAETSGDEKALATAESAIEAAKKDRRYFKEDEARLIEASLADSIDFVVNPPTGNLEAFSGLANKVSFLWTLGANVSSMVVNMANLGTVVVPFLAGKAGVGFNDALSAVSIGSRLFSSSGTSHMVRMYGAENLAEGDTSKVEQMKVVGNSIDNYYVADANGNLTIRDDMESLDDPFYDMKGKGGKVKTLTKREFLELVMPIVAEADSRGLLGRSLLADTLDIQVDKKSTGAFNYITGLAALPFHTAERFVRQSTLIGSFLTEMQRINNEPNAAKGEADLSTSAVSDAAVAQAIYDTQRTNGGSSIATAPAIAKRNIFRTAMMFKTFGAQMYFTELMTVIDSFKGSGLDDYSRRQAAKQFIGIQGAVLLLAGASGNTMYGMIAGLANLGVLGDEEEDFETLTRQAIGELVYKGGVYGVTDALGAGLDVSERIGLANMLIGTGKYNFNNTWEADLLSIILGPSYGTITSWMRGTEQVAQGELARGIETMVPTALRNPIRAYRYATEDGVRSNRGDIVLEDGTLSSGQFAAKFFGFMPAEYSRVMELRSLSKGIDVAINERKSRIAGELYNRKRNGLPEADVRDKIRKFNQDNPQNPIDREYLDRSLKQRRQTSKDMLAGTTISKPNRQIALDIMDSTSHYPDIDKMYTNFDKLLGLE